MTLAAEWILGILIAIVGSVMGVMFTMVLRTGRRTVQHDVMFAKISEIPNQITELRRELERAEAREGALYSEVRRKIEKHEEREDCQFAEIGKKIERLIVNVALLKKSPNGDDKING